jgi:uncharacterized protein (DUF4415 family)
MKVIFMNKTIQQQLKEKNTEIAEKNRTIKEKRIENAKLQSQLDELRSKMDAILTKKESIKNKTERLKKSIKIDEDKTRQITIRLKVDTIEKLKQEETMYQRLINRILDAWVSS